MERFITFLASFLVFFVFLTIPILWFSSRKNREVALHALTSSVLTFVIAEYLKEIFGTTRPYAMAGSIPLTITVPLDGAFPSTHTAITAALAVSIFLHNKKLGSVLLVFSMIIGWARVTAQVHWPIDIMGGFVLGALVAWSIHRLHVYKTLRKFW
jgi:undecaprenyl-diphosphatase